MAVDRSEIVETYVDGAVVVFGDPEKRYDAPTTTEVTLEGGKVRILSQPDGIHSPTRVTGLEVVTAQGTERFSVETRVVSDSAINPQSTVLNGGGWGKPAEVLGHMWGDRQEITLAGKLLGSPIDLRARAMVSDPLVNRIKAKLTP